MVFRRAKALRCHPKTLVAKADPYGMTNKRAKARTTTAAKTTATAKTKAKYRDSSPSASLRVRMTTKIRSLSMATKIRSLGMTTNKLAWNDDKFAENDDKNKFVQDCG